MSCIAGLVEKGRVYLGGDSCASDEWTHHNAETEKVFFVGQALVGSVGSFRARDLLRWEVKLPKFDGRDADSFMRVDFVRVIRKAFEAGGYPRSEQGKPQGHDLLVGLAGRLWQIADDFSVVACPPWGAAIGSGREPALGALWTLRAVTMQPHRRLRRALAAAEAISNGVQGPFKILSL